MPKIVIFEFKLMKIIKIYLILTVIIGLLSQGCSNESFENTDHKQPYNNNQDPPKPIESLNLSETDQLKVKFGRVLAKALKDSPELRQFIKQEALKQFNNDYDVLFNMVRHKPLNNIPSTRLKNGVNNSLEGLLEGYFEDKNELSAIQSQLPLLTVFVPKLPENSFSAETWDTNDPDQIPVVGIRVDNTNEVPMVDAVNNHEYILEDDLIPGYPVVVIKNNERLAVNTDDNNFARSTEVIEAQDGTSYRFLDDNLNASMTKTNNTLIKPIDPEGGSCNPPFAIIPGRDNTVPQFIKTAHNVFDGRISQPWQRDNIYYQLTTTQTTNTYVGGKYLEAITYFRLNGVPEDVFSSMSNQNNSANPDPIGTNQSWERDRTRVPWTDGNFEIGISITDNAKNRPNINFAFSFDAAPESLFTYSYESVVRWRGAWPIRWKRTYWRPKIDGFKGMDFTSTNLDATKLHIHAWDLTEYSNIWNLEIKELDVSTEITTKTASVKKYNTNINIDTSIPLGEKTKLGLKFGASLEEENSSERNHKWIEGSDLLGFLEIPFGDKVVNKNPCDNKLYPRLYTNGRVTIEMRPLQVEF